MEKSNIKILVSVDSFKGSLESIEAGEIIKEGILDELDGDIVVKPLADGGEGTVDALVTGLDGKYIKLNITGPLGDKIKGRYGVVGNKAIMEMAISSGLTLVEENERNPMKTTTYGLGEMIVDALDKGYREFIIGIGGSATNDIGIGMLNSLGYRFLDGDGIVVGINGKDLSNIVSIYDSKVDRRLKGCLFEIACDVDNPLYGENGAAAVYGPQKGASKKDIENLDRWAINFSNIVKEKYDLDFALYEGVGAAGGLGYAFKVFLNGNLLKGVDIITKFLKLEDDIKDSQLVITGEGGMDYQTIMGKAPIGVARIAEKYNIPVIAIAGSLGKDVEKLNDYGIDAYFSIVPKPMSLEEAMNSELAGKNLKDTIKQIIRVYKMNIKNRN